MPNQTVLEIGLKNGIEIPHRCGGVCHCTTCHIYIEKGMELLEPPSRREIDFLKKVIGVKLNSRLSCQCLLIDSSGEIELSIPEQSVKEK